jgi:hypothetical protein
MSKPFLTKHPELQWLMSFEFHKSGQTDFDPTDPENYLHHRLTQQQNDVLENLATPGWLTAFLTFGDGCIDHAIGGTRHIGQERYKVVRPNTSLALFYKHKTSGKIELVFYTRYLSISYAFYTDKKTKDDTVSKRIAGNHNQLDTERNRNKRRELQKKILKDMLKLPPFKSISPVNSPYSTHQNKKYYFRIADWFPVGSVWEPWIGARDQRKIRFNIPKWLGLENTIHGLIDSNQCWMLFPNFLWLWPWENKPTPKSLTSKETDYFYTALNKCYIRYDKWEFANTSKPLPTSIQECIDNLRTKLENALSPFPSSLQSGWTKKMFENDSRNPVYFEFIRMFVGLPYNAKSNKLKFPKLKETLEYEVMSHPLFSNTKKRFFTNITIPEPTFIKGEKIQFTSGSQPVRAIVHFNDGFITVNQNLYDVPKMNDKFKILYKNNCWKVPSNKYTPNFFGHTAKKKYWAHVYIFKRDDRFTYDSNDKDEFKFKGP